MQSFFMRITKTLDQAAVEAQADFSLYWAYMSEGTYSYIEAKLSYFGATGCE